MYVHYSSGWDRKLVAKLLKATQKKLVYKGNILVKRKKKERKGFGWKNIF